MTQTNPHRIYARYGQQRTIHSTIGYLRKRIAVIVLLGISLSTLGCSDRDDVNSVSAPATQQPRISVTVSPVPTSTPLPTATPEADLSAESRKAAVEFLTAIEIPGRKYVASIFKTLDGSVIVFTLIGKGDFEGGLELYRSNIETYRQVLTSVNPPQNVPNSSAIISAGIDALNLTDEWIDEVQSRLDSGDVVDPVMLLADIEQRYRSAVNNDGIELKRQLRSLFEIDDQEVTPACYGRYAGTCV